MTQLRGQWVKTPSGTWNHDSAVTDKACSNRTFLAGLSLPQNWYQGTETSETFTRGNVTCQTIEVSGVISSSYFLKPNLKGLAHHW